MKDGPPELDLPGLRRRLLAWYDRHRRVLPWRRKPIDPYATLVSEAMLQQTQVATVIPYFERFMDRFPTVRDLARAETGEVLACWAGLGYYRRCHHLHAAARRIVEDHAARVPAELEKLMALPGVGRYTAGAIASIAFGAAVPAIDGNARRVVTRLLGREPAHASPALMRELWNFAAAWVSRRRPGDFNQALMELGARVCTPRRPQCSACPLRSSCAYPAGRNSARLRPRPNGRTLPELPLVAVAIEHNGRLLYRQRPTGGLWGGLWEWPTEPLADGERPAEVARRLLAAFAPKTRRRVQPLGVMTHVLSHRRVTFHAFHVIIPGVTAVRDGLRWCGLNDRAAVPMSRAQARLLDALEAAAGERERGRRTLKAGKE